MMDETEKSDVVQKRIGPGARSKGSPLSRALTQQKFQLAGGIAVAALLPLLVWVIVGTPSHVGDYGKTTLIVCLAIFLAHVFVQELARYPGESPLSTTLPSVSGGFGIVVVGITFTHGHYSRGLLLAGYLLTILWYAIIVSARGRYLRKRLALVAAGNAAGMSHISSVDWHILSSPSFEAMQNTQGIVVDLDADLSPEWREFLTNCAVSGTPVYDSTKTREMMTGQVALTHLSDIGFEALLPHRFYLFVKSILDIVAAVLLLPVAVPAIGIAMIAVRLESKGAAIFVQKRLGHRGHIFNCYKIRTMHSDHAGAGPHFTTDGDPRVTRVGKFLRKYRIDELPQIFNILKGEMSWIGPRPEAVPLSRSYNGEVPFYHFRHSVKPGISGWAAIHLGNVAEVDAATAKLRYDFFYIKNLSFPLDVYIACRTIWILLTGFGSR